VLVVDDEPALRDNVRYALEQAGWAVDEAVDGRDALTRIDQRAYDIVVLDIMLPGISGLDVCRTVRAASDVPIIMLTARDAELDRVAGLEIGADDYLTKPFSLAELTSRIRAMLRRRDLDRAPGRGTVVKIGGIEMNTIRHIVTVDDQVVQLTPSEFRVLLFLAQQPGRAFTRRQIMQHLWQTTFIADERACDVHISTLRRKLESDSRHPRRLLTVRGIGYKLIEL
jgi:two-component system response regulator RegX3